MPSGTDLAHKQASEQHMTNTARFYIDGKWVEPVAMGSYPVINPATEATIATIGLAGREDVDRAVAAARRAFSEFAATAPAARAALLGRICDVYKARFEDLAQAI